MKHGSIICQLDNTETLEHLADAIRADAQQDVDVEHITDGNTRSSGVDESEFAKNVSAAAQSFISASPNSLGPPINPCARYLLAKQCGKYGRRNSTVWISPFIPKLDNEGGRRGLLDHQVTGIVWLLSRLFGDLPTLKCKDPLEGTLCSNIQSLADADNRDRLKGPKYFGGILADSMGLGKTLIVVALVNILISQGLNTMRRKNGKIEHLPILLIAPNATVACQWVQEFKNVLDESTLHQIILSGPGLEEITNTVHLDRESFNQWPAPLCYVWDKNDSRASKVIIITTMESWAGRTCSFKADQDQGGWSSTFTRKKRSFSLVIVDEAYKVKNHRTKNWRSVYLLKRQFTLLITATPCMNSLTDMFGLATLLWTGVEKYLDQNPTTRDEMRKEFQDLEHLDELDSYPASHDFQLVAGRPGLLTKLLFKKGNARTHDIELTRQYLRHFETLAMLKRSPSSYIYADWEQSSLVSLEGLFPKVENYTVDISAGQAYDGEYQTVHTDLLIEYLECLTAWGGISDDGGKKPKKEEEEAKTSIMNANRLLQIASSSLDVHDLNTILLANGHSTLAPEIAKMRENEVDLRRLVQFLLLPTDVKPDTHVGWMKIATRNSPILRYILHYIHKNILTREDSGKIKKLLIIEHSLVLAFYYELVLQFLGFECRCMHAQLTLGERQQLVDSFNSSDNDSCQILIQLYTVGFAGTNLHKSCSRVLVASQAHSIQVQWQAMHRVIRVGQTSDVTVHRVKLKNSYHAFRESRQIEKLLPELGSRAQGDTKKVLVLLLNLFQYEVRDAWNSPEGQELRRQRNLLDEEDSDKEAESPASKKVKSTTKLEVNAEGKHIKKEEAKRIKKEDEDEASNKSRTSNSHSSIFKKRKRQTTDEPRIGDGTGGWFNQSCGYTRDEEAETEDFLKLRTRDEYYGEFIELPRDVKSVFNHSKNSLRRLLSFGNSGGELSTKPWDEDDLEFAPTLERALELMLRVRLGARDIAMLPFPMIDLSQTPTHRRAELQRLIAGLKHTDQDFHVARAASTGDRDSKDTLRETDLNQSPEQIEADLKVHHQYGDPESTKGAAKKGKSVAVETAIKNFADVAGDLGQEDENDEGEKRREEEEEEENDEDADEEDNVV
ncbi:P-loop containing nucleoside triphosphate hydrolase protein [Xylaria bambusicola]|uniref:P-loop containing nucleoside triphosphate hydrolase protein n=1 Tax=Xylaria bambusicola TaxID=326684 RepID=UPI002007D5DD|nr:P-loop containing nucleoside triphosphate hydrolase protein [Xylaria bambusicola]KAI0521787.1 P-loop containing nucleoside triphosphate hydrolase protein [Xylaria bambusicola]